MYSCFKNAALCTLYPGGSPLAVPLVAFHPLPTKISKDIPIKDHITKVTPTEIDPWGSTQGITFPGGSTPGRIPIEVYRNIYRTLYRNLYKNF